MKGKFISLQAHQCAKLLAEVCFQWLMFKEVYLTITACFQPSGTAVVTGSRKGRLTCYSHQTLCLQQRAISSLSKRILLLLAVSRVLFARPGSADLIHCPPARGQPLDLCAGNWKEGVNCRVAWFDMSHTATATPDPSFRAPWKVGNSVVSRGNAGWTTSKSGHSCPCQNCSQGLPAGKAGRGSLRIGPSCPPDHPIGQETELKWTDHRSSPSSSMIIMFVNIGMTTVHSQFCACLLYTSDAADD